MAISSNKATVLVLALLLVAVATAAVLIWLQPWKTNPTQTDDQWSGVIGTGPGTEFIEPALWGLLYRHAAGDEGVLKQVEIDLVVHEGVGIGVSLDDAIADVGGVHVADATARVPTGSIAALIQRPDVGWAYLAQGAYETAVVPDVLSRSSGGLDTAVMAHSSGVPASEAALVVLGAKEGNVGAIIDAPDAPTWERVQTWLGDRNIYMPRQKGTGHITEHTVAVMMPVGESVPFLTAFDNAWIDAFSLEGQGLTISRQWWPQETRELEEQLLDFFTSGEAPDDGGSQTAGNEMPPALNESPNADTTPNSPDTGERQW